MFSSLSGFCVRISSLCMFLMLAISCKEKAGIFHSPATHFCLKESHHELCLSPPLTGVDCGIERLNKNRFPIHFYQPESIEALRTFLKGTSCNKPSLSEPAPQD